MTAPSPRNWADVLLPDGYGDRADEALMALVEILDGTELPDIWSLRRTARTVLGILATDGRAGDPADYDMHAGWPS